MSLRTLGVVGTLVWDRFVRPAPEASAGTTALEGWGGIAYALSALSAALPDGWTIRPLLKVGADLFEEGARFLGSIPRMDLDRLVEVPEPNNRVELRYDSAEERRERLVGGVPPWEADELADMVRGCDALYVNFVSGLEMDLPAARVLADAFDGPRYGDLHSLFLGVDEIGRRIPRQLDEAWSWARCFHAVQVNEEELRLAGGEEEPWGRAAREVAGDGPGLVAVTLGARGSACVKAAGIDPDPWRWGRAAGRPRQAAETVRAPTARRSGDPTGCGDVWGATFYARLLAGDRLLESLEWANRLAGLNVEHRSAQGLAHRLAERSATVHHHTTRGTAPA